MTTDTDKFTVVTNNVPRPIIEADELTLDERKEFDYINWRYVELGEETASFFRYKGQLYDIAEFSYDYGLLKGSGLPERLSKWDAYQSDTFFSATVIRFVDNYEYVVVGRVFT